MATEYKLSYTASEIDKKLGQIDNLAAKDEIPTKTSDLTNDSGYITGYTETDPTVPAWAKASMKPSYSKSEVGLSDVDNIKQYSSKNPPVVYQSEAPTDTSVVWVDADDNTVDEFQDAINLALAQAKASGEFNGTSVAVTKVIESTEDGGSNVVTFSDGKTVTIKNGSKGNPGATPVKGTDYWTNADQEAIVQQVIAALPVYNGEVV